MPSETHMPECETYRGTCASNDVSTAIDQTVLVVDLDGTLLRTDMLHENFWSAFSRDWRTPIFAVTALSKGRAALKKRMSFDADIDITTLPYDAGVVEYIHRWRARGGRTALVTASDVEQARSIAAHLDIFDEVYGSDGNRNLKGPEKARFLNQTFGMRGYDYIADASADMAVWKDARRSITVNAPDALRKQVDGLGQGSEHLETTTRSGKFYCHALRPHQWLKNILVFIPMLAGHQINAVSVFQSLLAFFAFSVIASSVYVLNDLLDLKADRAHTRKSQRPFASGRIPLAHGAYMFAGLIAVGALLAASLGGMFILAMLAYFGLTTVYSLTLKRRVVVDIITLAGLYTMRLAAGAVAVGIPLSIWLMAFSVFIFFSLACVKRQAELVDGAARGQLTASGRGYHVEDLPLISMMAMSSGFVAVLVLMLYVNSPEVQQLYSNPLALLGICAVMLYWISRIVMLTHRGHMDDDPVVFAAKDRNSQICILVIAAFVVLGVA
ncbi:UbiA family prenyltransferase [Sulfitobacter sp. 915]|uniref:UbiA family prenyltransferase n=1 Tax=Sulfitobacter sp. 915 TaxID=3368558 RepID=UPI003744BA1A